MDEESPHEESEYREVEYEEHLSREDVLDHLEAFLEAFRAEETVTLTIGDETVEFDPPERLEFEVEYEEAGDERELEFELEWEVGGDELTVGSDESGAAEGDADEE